jgi:pimeloyl-ACP methyl ester carboxylesterase
MIYTTLLRSVFRALYGEPSDAAAGSALVVVADGVGGLDLCGTALKHVAAAEGEPLDVRSRAWGHGLGRWHADLTNVENHEVQAAAIAAEVRAFRAEHPETPAFLVGKSGGTGVVIRALEALPADSVEAVVLLASALSPGYDLSRALRAVRREMVVFWSPLDVFVLGLGTRLFGTIDRVRSVSAGLVGFRPPPGLDEAGRLQYAKLRQVKWGPAMAGTGYLGGHVGPDLPAFLRRYVLPILRPATAVEGDSEAVSSRPRDAPIT